MKIALIIDSLAIGGAQKHLVQLVRGLRGRGHEAWVYCLNDEAHSVYLEALALSGVPVRVFGARRVLSGRALADLVMAFQVNQVQVVVTVLFVSTVLGRVAAKLVGVGTVVTCIQARNANFRSWQFAALVATAGLSDAFAVNAKTAMTFAWAHEGVARRRCVFVPNAIEPIVCHSRVPGDRQRAGFPFGDEHWLIGTLGRLDPQKGYDVLLRAFARVVVRRPEARLVIVGEGRSERDLKRLAEDLGISEYTFFAGGRESAENLLMLFDVYVQPSRFEGTPNAVMEAMATARPVVASSADGNAELISPGSTGWLVPVEDVECLASTLVEVHENPEDAFRTALSGQIDVQARFPVSRMVDGYLAVFRACAPHRTPLPII